MLFPQFSLRQILLATAVLAVISLVGTQAVQGSHWALGVSMGVASLFVAILVYAGLFFVVWMVSSALAGRKRAKDAVK